MGPLIIDLAGTELAPMEADILRHPLVGGIILFSRNYEDKHQLKALVRQIREVNPELLLCVDHEGGRVQRFRKDFTRIPSMQALARSCPVEGDGGQFQLVRDAGWLLAAELIASGLDFSFTPVLDLDDERSEIIGDRSFDPSPHHCARIAGEFIAGLHEAGMAATGKHFPGHGSVVADSHLTLPVDDRAWSDIAAHDLIPFKLLASQLQGVMPAHVLYPQVDGDNPAGFSPFWIQEVLRQQLGFDGVVFSDDLSMAGAVEVGDVLTRAERAFSAGCDSVLVCNDRASVEVLLEQWRPDFSPDSQRRLGAMRAGKNITWQDLKASERWQQTVQALQALVANSQ